MHLLLTICILLFRLWCSECGNVKHMYQWKEVLYENLSLTEDTYIGKHPYYIPSNNYIIGIGYHAQSRLMLVSLGRHRVGIPATVNAFCTTDYPESTIPHFWGFPNYEVNTLVAEDYDKSEQKDSLDIRLTASNDTLLPLRIISVSHPIIDDRCNRAFLLDTGVVRITNDTRYYIQKPSLVVFSLPANGCCNRDFPLIRKVVIPDNLWINPEGLMYCTLDYQPRSQTEGSCEDLIVYITNTFDHRIIVYDYAKDKFWLFGDHPSFYPIERESYIKGYHIPYGIMNLALGWSDKMGNKIAYYSPGSSTGVYAVTTKTLRNPMKSSPYYYGSEFRLVGLKGYQAHRQEIDLNTGVMFFAELTSGAVTCWHIGKTFNPNNIGVVYQSQEGEMFTDIFVDSEGYLWILSGQVHLMFSSEVPLELNEINSRVHKVSVKDAIKGTVCEHHEEFSYEITWDLMVK